MEGIEALKGKGLSGRRGRTRTGDPLLRRQMLYPPELRAHIVPLLILNYFQLRNHPDSCFLRPNCIKTVSKPLQFGLPVSKLGPCSFAWRLSFCNASRSICNFICEYFLDT